MLILQRVSQFSPLYMQHKDTFEVLTELNSSRQVLIIIFIFLPVGVVFVQRDRRLVAESLWRELWGGRALRLHSALP